jgi:thioredoxin 1
LRKFAFIDTIQPTNQTFSMEQTFTDANFQSDVLGSAKPVLVDFWAAWCGPCRVMAPIIEELAGELEGQLTVGKMNVDEHPQTPGGYNILSIPTFLLFKNGQVAEQMVGTMSKEQMKERIMKHLG